MNARRLIRALNYPPILRNNVVVQTILQSPHTSLPIPSYHTASYSRLPRSSPGASHGNFVPCQMNCQNYTLKSATCSFVMSKALFSSASSTIGEGATEAVKEVYEKMLKSVAEQRTAPPNAWLWLLIEKCANHEDIKLLFEILQKLRIFKLSNLRIHENFNCALCREITKACTRVGAIEFGKKVLWMHNVYGLTPNTGSAHHLLLYARQNNDAKLMEEIMKLLKKNNLILGPGTADIVLSICYELENWDLMSKYAKMFVKEGLKLRKTTFDAWMQLAAKRGDTDSLWKIEKLRSESMKQHTLASGFSCAMGLLLERKPEEAAAVIRLLNQSFSDKKRPGISVELQKLVHEWPSGVVKRQKAEDREALEAALQNDMLAMISALPDMGLEVKVNLEDFTRKEAVSA